MPMGITNMPSGRKKSSAAAKVIISSKSQDAKSHHQQQKRKTQKVIISSKSSLKRHGRCLQTSTAISFLYGCCKLSNEHAHPCVWIGEL
jgi:hypothetical protein